MAEKRKFFEVEIPVVGDRIKLIAERLEQLNDRTIKLDLTRILKGKSIEGIFKVKVSGGKANAEMTKISLMPFFIRRMMRKSISYVEDSFPAECSDAFLRVKFFLITRKKVTRAVRKALRDGARNYLVDYVKDKIKDEIFSEIIANKLQRTLSMKLKKIYPLALCEIREIKLEKEKEIVKTEKIMEAENKAEEKTEN